MRVNIGCGRTTTTGYKNLDNSLSLRLAKVPFLAGLLKRLRLIKKPQYDYIEFARTHNVEFGDVTRRLPFPDNSVEVLYSSHMIEHLDRYEMDHFLKEAMRVLQPGGTIRLVFPDIQHYVQKYLQNRDADEFVAGTLMTQSRPRTLAERLHMLFVGARHHLWMYDGESLSRLLTHHGFVNASPLPAGQTKMADCGALDLSERSENSGYVEAEKPVLIDKKLIEIR